MHSDGNDAIANLVFWKGFEGWEPETAKTLAMIASQCSTFFDVGANIGYHALVVAAVSPSTTVHAFEPVSAIFDRLGKNVQLNKFDSILLYKCGLSNAPGRAKIHIPRQGGLLSLQASLLPYSGYEGIEEQDVEVTTVDTVVEECGIPHVDLMKIDVEGAEHLVIAGAESTLRRDRPLVICEVLPAQPGVVQVQEALLHHGYEFFLLTTSGLESMPGLTPHPKGTVRNYLCAHPDRLKEFFGQASSTVAARRGRLKGKIRWWPSVRSRALRWSRASLREVVGTRAPDGSGGGRRSESGFSWDHLPGSSRRSEGNEVPLSRHRYSIRLFVVLATLFMPQSVKLGVLRRLSGWTVGRNVRIGFSLVDADSVVLEDNVQIGHFNLFVNVNKLWLGEGGVVRNFNSFHGGGPLVTVGFPSSVRLGRRSKMMSHHFVDCAGSLVVGDDVVIGGRSTEIYTHQRSLRDNVPVLEPSEVVIGDDTYVGARCTLVSCTIPAGAVIGAGAVVVGAHLEVDPEERVLLAGNPARIMKRYPPGSSRDS
ncbi:MAG: FkbM family methyltransferase [Acidimicrobiales bacterium]